jgi:hypothetical protein
VAGVGSDPREDRYFLIPKQARDYDKDGAYMRTWLPELASVPADALCDPRRISERLRGAYPAPIVTLLAHRGAGGGSETCAGAILPATSMKTAEPCRVGRRQGTHSTRAAVETGGSGAAFGGAGATAVPTVGRDASSEAATTVALPPYSVPSRAAVAASGVTGAAVPAATQGAPEPSDGPARRGVAEPSEKSAICGADGSTISATVGYAGRGHARRGRVQHF